MSSPNRVEVVRTGGFAGLRRVGEVDLGQDSRASEVESLLDRIDVGALPAHDPKPDRFVYTFTLRGHTVTVGEQDLTPELHRLSQILLD